MKTIRMGTRGSQLALWQATYVEGMLKRQVPDISLERILIKTEGDTDQQSSLRVIGGQGVFTKAIEKALLDGKIDLAVHSLKDLPSVMDPSLKLGAVPERGPVEDVLVTADGRSFADLPMGARIATGSIRRRSQLLHMRADLEICDLRGNIDTRLRKLEEQDLDAIIMARAALVRLKLDEVRYYTFGADEMLPAVGQGAVGIQIRREDAGTEEVAARLSHLETLWAVTAERAMLRELDSGCQFPVGALGRITKHRLLLEGFVGSEDGQTVLREQVEADPGEAEDAGLKLAHRLMDRGALDLLKR
ncbi:MAG: hydroxymethylbilane synthase [Candidatus Latescibacterota bacterium]